MVIAYGIVVFSDTALDILLKALSLDSLMLILAIATAYIASGILGIVLKKLANLLIRVSGSNKGHYHISGNKREGNLIQQGG